MLEALKLTIKNAGFYFDHLYDNICISIKTSPTRRNAQFMKYFVGLVTLSILSHFYLVDSDELWKLILSTYDRKV